MGKSKVLFLGLPWPWKIKICLWGDFILHSFIHSFTEWLLSTIPDLCWVFYPLVGRQSMLCECRRNPWEGCHLPVGMWERAELGLRMME